MAASRIPRSVEIEFWSAVAGGVEPGPAAARLGVSASTGQRWFAEAGGMRPSRARPPVQVLEPLMGPAPGPRPRLSHAERDEIQHGVSVGESIRAIAARLGRAPSTVMREINRSGSPRSRYRRRYRPGAAQQGRPYIASYRASRAQARAEWRARRPKTRRLVNNPVLHAEVQTRLELKHSPQQISRRLRAEFPDRPEMWMSHEAIYQALYVQGRGGLRRELAACLRTGRALRRPRGRVETRGSRPGLISISERPAEADDRAVPGHWEGDLITGAHNRSAIGTLVERTTRFVMLLHLPVDHGADAVAAAMVTTMSTLPATLRRTLAWDRGSEMANHAQISAATDLQIYFCDPASPWQRGTNENTNGLLRQYFPKGTDLSGYHSDYLEFVADQLNNRPRQTLNWATPAETLDRLLSDPPTPGVASTA